jgi:hypothetical protein
MTTWPDPDSPGAHPVLENMTEAVRLTGDAAAFLSPTRMFDEPDLEESDWPRDLDSPGTQQMLRHLADIADHASTCISGIGCQHSIADAAKPELHEIDQLLSEACRRLRALDRIPGPETQAATPVLHAGLDFPATPAAIPPDGPARKAAPGTAAPHTARHPKP